MRLGTGGISVDMCGLSPAAAQILSKARVQVRWGLPRMTGVGTKARPFHATRAMALPCTHSQQTFLFFQIKTGTAAVQPSPCLPEAPEPASLHSFAPTIRR